MTPQEWKAKQEAMTEEERRAFKEKSDAMICAKRELLMYALSSMAEGFHIVNYGKDGIKTYSIGNVTYSYKKGDNYFTESEWEPISGEQVKPLKRIYFSELLLEYRWNKLKENIDELFGMY